MSLVYRFLPRIGRLWGFLVARVDDLKWALDVARESITSADPDKRSPLIGQYRALLAEIAELEGDQPEHAEGKVNGLVVLQEELAKRQQSGAAGSRRTARRNV